MQADTPYPGCGSNRTSNQRNTAHVMLYCTWRPSGLATGLRGQRSLYICADKKLANSNRLCAIEIFANCDWLCYHKPHARDKNVHNRL